MNIDSQAIIVHPESVYSMISRNVQLRAKFNNNGTYGMNQTGNILWDGSFLLSRLLERDYECILKDKKVLELGSGVAAFPSQVAACLGANVIATDVSEIIDSLESNIICNQDHNKSRVIAKVLDWLKFLDDCDSFDFVRGIDYILCADLVYTDSYEYLELILDELVKINPNVTILMTNTDRLQVRKFYRRLLNERYNVETIFVDDIVRNLNLSLNQIVWKITKSVISC